MATSSMPEQGARNPLAAAIRLAARGDLAAAVALLESARFGPDDEPAARAFQSELLARLARWEESKAVLSAAFSAYPDHPALALRAGVSCWEKGDVEAARRWWTLAWTRGALPAAAFRLGELARAEAREGAERWWALAASSEGAGGTWRCLAEERLAGDRVGAGNRWVVDRP